MQLLFVAHKPVSFADVLTYLYDKTVRLEWCMYDNVVQSYQRDYSVGMNDNRAVHRLDMRITEEQQRIIEQLKEKLHLNRPAVVGLALKRLADAELGVVAKKTTRTKK
jgi:hypothetical protein